MSELKIQERMKEIAFEALDISIVPVYVLLGSMSGHLQWANKAYYEFFDSVEDCDVMNIQIAVMNNFLMPMETKKGERIFRCEMKYTDKDIICFLVDVTEEIKMKKIIASLE